MPVSKYRAAAADDVVTGNFWALPLTTLVLSVDLAGVWGCAAVTAAARKSANIRRGNRIGLPGAIGAQFAFRPQRDGGNRIRVILLMPDYFGIFQVSSLSMAAPASGQSDGRRLQGPQSIFVFHISDLACLIWYYDPLDEEPCTSVTQRGEDIQHLTF